MNFPKQINVECVFCGSTEFLLPYEEFQPSENELLQCANCGRIAEEDVLQIDSDKKGSVKPEEWKQIKQSLFNIDKKPTPKVVVSVLMLREGFDVSNVCVIVPLRSSQAPILLEQVIGRGLRLMWREPDYDEIKAENRHKMLDLKQEPNG